MLLSLPSPLIYFSNFSLVDAEITALQKSLSNEQVTHVSRFENPGLPVLLQAGVLPSHGCHLYGESFPTQKCVCCV